MATDYESIKNHSRQALAEGYDQVVAVGGDGTINAVLNGFYDRSGNLVSHARMGVIYTGTSPDFCKSYGIPLDHEKAVRCLAEGTIRKMGPGMITFMQRNGHERVETRYFACCANIGIGAGIARDANRIRRYAGDMPGTFISMMKNLAGFRSKTIFLEMDRKQFILEKAVNISIGRTPYIASGIHVGEGGILEKEHFYVLIARDLSLRSLPGLIRQIYSGKIGNHHYLRLAEGKNIILCSDELVEVEFDGDPAGQLPCIVGMASDTLDLIVCQEG
jgi:diacylglycerol kinase family enzyme